MSETKNIFIRDDRLLRSVVADVVTIGSMLGSVFIGWVIGSEALQWVGALLWVFWVIGRATSFQKASTMTISQARAFLDKLEKEKS